MRLLRRIQTQATTSMRPLSQTQTMNNTPPQEGYITNEELEELKRTTLHAPPILFRLIDSITKDRHDLAVTKAKRAAGEKDRDALRADIVTQIQDRVAVETRLWHLRKLLKFAHDAMLNWFSSEYAENEKTRHITDELARPESEIGAQLSAL